MTKFQLMLTSLVAVIPGAFLVLLLVMALLSHSENLTTIAYVVIGATLLTSTAVVLLPAGIFVGGRRKPAQAKSAGKKSTGDEIEAVDDDIAVVDVDEISDDDDLVMGTSDFDVAESDESSEMSFEDDIETELVEEADSFEFEDDDFDIDEDPKPKKKK